MSESKHTPFVTSPHERQVEHEQNVREALRLMRRVCAQASDPKRTTAEGVLVVTVPSALMDLARVAIAKVEE